MESANRLQRDVEQELIRLCGYDGLTADRVKKSAPKLQKLAETHANKRGLPIRPSLAEITRTFVANGLNDLEHGRRALDPVKLGALRAALGLDLSLPQLNRLTARRGAYIAELAKQKHEVSESTMALVFRTFWGWQRMAVAPR